MTLPHLRANKWPLSIKTFQSRNRGPLTQSYVLLTSPQQEASFLSPLIQPSSKPYTTPLNSSPLFQISLPSMIKFHEVRDFQFYIAFVYSFLYIAAGPRIEAHKNNFNSYWYLDLSYATNINTSKVLQNSKDHWTSAPLLCPYHLWSLSTHLSVKPSLRCYLLQFKTELLKARTGLLGYPSGWQIVSTFPFNYSAISLM